MDTSKRMRRSLVALLAIAASMLAIGAGPAMAEPHFSDTAHGIKVSGTLTVLKNGGSSKTCTASSIQTGEFTDAYSAEIRGAGWLEQLTFSCAGSTLGMVAELNVVSTTSLEFGGYFESATSPWLGSYYQGVWPGGEGRMIGDWKNGSGATASTLTFSSDKLGATYDAGNPTVTASGTLKVTTSSGGLITLLP